MKEHTFAFASTTYDFEVYQTGTFPTLAAAAQYAAQLADDLQTDIEIWQERITVMPYTRYLDGGMINDAYAIDSRNAAIEREVRDAE